MQHLIKKSSNALRLTVWLLFLAFIIKLKLKYLDDKNAIINSLRSNQQREHVIVFLFTVYILILTAKKHL